MKLKSALRKPETVLRRAVFCKIWDILYCKPGLLGS